MAQAGVTLQALSGSDPDWKDAVEGARVVASPGGIRHEVALRGTWMQGWRRLSYTNWNTWSFSSRGGAAVAIERPTC